jgi:tyrosine-protein kinase Etk/Wzc
MMSKPNKDENFIISFADLKKILEREKKKIALSALLFACLSILYTLIEQPQYMFEATFREKGRAGGVAISLSQVFLGGGSGLSESEAASLMKSRKLLEKTASKLNLQATLSKIEPRFEYLENIKNNLIVSKALFDDRREPSLPEKIVQLKPIRVSYKGEIPLGFHIKVLTENTLEINGAGLEKKILHLGEQVEGDNYSFSIISNAGFPKRAESYVLLLQPLSTVAQNMSNQLKIEPDKQDLSLLRLKYNHPDRHLGTEILNTHMSIFQDFLLEEQQNIMNKQIAYLEHRQKEMGDSLQEMMEDYACKLCNDLSSIGFSTSTKAMEFLSGTQNNLQQKLKEIELETKRLQKAQVEGYAYYEGYHTHGDPSIINHLLSEIRQLKQQADGIDIWLRNAPAHNSEHVKESFHKQMNEMNEIRRTATHAKELLLAIEEGKHVNTTTPLFADSKFLVQTWFEKLMDAQKSWEQSPLEHKFQKAEDLSSCKTSFLAYLSHLVHLLEVHEKALEERLTHQQNTVNEFQGIDLTTAKELYINYTRDLNNIEAAAIQSRHIINQIQLPEFEISSLSTVLNDPICLEMISKASRTVLALTDQNNRSLKEQERLKEEIVVQKSFLTMHLNQSVQLSQLRIDMFNAKIRNLQSAILGLTHQQISILEKHLSDYIVTRLKDLKQEREVIESHQRDLKLEMASLPSKWVSERLIDTQMENNKKMMEEITKLVESKNIAHNLEIIQSAPIDVAIAPLHPRSPRLLLFSVLGAIMGTFFASTYFFMSSLIKGVNVSEENLKLAGYHVSGTLSKGFETNTQRPSLDQDLNTLRKIIAHFAPSDDQSSLAFHHCRELLLIQGKGPDFSESLATLISKRGLKVLIVPLNFDQPALSEGPGLLQYIEGQVEAPTIKRKKFYDQIEAGGISRFSSELIGTLKFKNLMTKLAFGYDWIIATCHANPTTAEAETALKIFSNAVVTVSDEKLTELEIYHALGEKDTKKKITFIVATE